jgi:hypothetical protein
MSDIDWKARAEGLAEEVQAINAAWADDRAGWIKTNADLKAALAKLSIAQKAYSAELATRQQAEAKLAYLERRSGDVVDAEIQAINEASIRRHAARHAPHQGEETGQTAAVQPSVASLSAPQIAFPHPDVARLVEACKPFADAAKQFRPDDADTMRPAVVQAVHFRSLAEAIAPFSSTEEKG